MFESMTSFSTAIVHVNRYFSIIIFLFGSIGNILNIFVLSQRNLRINPCSWYFLISSIANLISIIFGLTTRILSSWNIDPTDTIDWICKLRTFIVFSSRTTAFWLITFATSDRWLSSCTNIYFRQLSSLKNAQRISIIISISFTLIHIQILYCYESNLLDTPLKCYGKTDLCRRFNDALYTSITILLPLILMLIFGILTILNVRQTQRRIQITNRDTNLISRQKKTDRHLLKMLIVQIILLTLLILPQAIQKIYITLTHNENKALIESFLYNIVLLLTFIASGIPFYIYTLCGGEIFRKALFDIFKC